MFASMANSEPKPEAQGHGRGRGGWGRGGGRGGWGRGRGGLIRVGRECGQSSLFTSNQAADLQKNCKNRRTIIADGEETVGHYVG
ncbi:unnamed protein product, partial [Cyprideis torosa]